MIRPHHIELKYPLLILQGSKGMLVCGYLDMQTLEETGEAAAKVCGVSFFGDMPNAIIKQVTPAAAKLGVKVGDTGQQALEKFE